MSQTLPVPTSHLPSAAEAELKGAVAILEGVSLPVRLAALVGGSVEMLKNRLPTGAQRLLDSGVRRALQAALKAALRSEPSRNPTPVPDAWFHRGLVAASGAAGGALGLPGTLIELPVSTTLLLRQIAAIAEAEGETLSDPETAVECLKVFAFGSRNPADNALESSYFTMRVALAEALRTGVGRSIGALLPGFVGAIASRFGGPVALKVSAQAAPLVGAATGAAVNLAFLEHFRGVARAHFTVRRLEREYGAAPVRTAYEALAAS